jgi:hypothetical protein
MGWWSDVVVFTRPRVATQPPNTHLIPLVFQLQSVASSSILSVLLLSLPSEVVSTTHTVLRMPMHIFYTLYFVYGGLRRF